MLRSSMLAFEKAYFSVIVYVGSFVNIFSVIFVLVFFFQCEKNFQWFSVS